MGRLGKGGNWREKLIQRKRRRKRRVIMRRCKLTNQSPTKRTRDQQHLADFQEKRKASTFSQAYTHFCSQSRILQTSTTLFGPFNSRSPDLRSLRWQTHSLS